MKKTMKSAIEAIGLKVFGEFVRVNGELFPMPLVKGNSKLGKNVWHSSTLPTNEIITATNPNGETIAIRGTCPITCKGCYGTCGNYRFNSVKYALMMRTKLLLDHPNIYFSLVRIQLTHEDIDRLRIHAVGDFVKGEAMGFYEVLKDFPNIKAWTYTKVQTNSELEALDSLPNMNIVKSIIKGCGFNFGHVAYIANIFYKLKREGKSVYICRCGIDKNQHCSDCNGCSDHEYVLFIEHSTGYNPQTDYGYEKMIELIENQ